MEAAQALAWLVIYKRVHHMLCMQVCQKAATNVLRISSVQYADKSVVSIAAGARTWPCAIARILSLKMMVSRR